MRPVIAWILICSATFPAVADAPGGQQTCALSAVIRVTSADDPAEYDLAGSWWYVNSDRTLWAGWDAARMKAGPDGNKVLWIRPKGEQLVLSAHRLDAESEPATLDVPCCYGGRLQASGLIFPSAGCWEISAKAGTSALTFVTLVDPRPVK